MTMTKYGPRRLIATTGIPLILAAILTLAAGCSAWNKTFNQNMTPVQAAIVIGDVWVAEWDAYKAAQDGHFTKAQAEVMNAKREVLDKMKPLVLTAGAYAKIGKEPPEATMLQLVQLYQELLLLLSRKGD